MLDWLWFGEPEQIVLREWEPELSVDYEFRLYINDSKLCAISQYDHYCRYDHLFPRKDEFEEKMRSLWQEIHPHVGPFASRIVPKERCNWNQESGNHREF